MRIWQCGRQSNGAARPKEAGAGPTKISLPRIRPREEQPAPAFLPELVVITTTLTSTSSVPSRVRGPIPAAEEVSQGDRDYGIDIRVGSHPRRRLVMNQPDVGGEGANLLFGHHQIRERDPRAARNLMRPKVMELAECCGHDREHNAAAEHLRGRRVTVSTPAAVLCVRGPTRSTN